MDFEILKRKISNENISLEEKKIKLRIIDAVFNENSIYAKSSADQLKIANLLLKDFIKEKMRSLKRNPELIFDYFEKINTKEKAYWLGFIYADGHISKTLDRFRFKLGIKDKSILENFCNALHINPNRIVIEKDMKLDKNYLVLQVYNQKIVRDLLFHKVIPAKTKFIEFPNLEKRELNLAFLLGYFDGDGIQGTSRIKSSSRIFLEQIKYLFQIKYEVKSISEKKFIQCNNNSYRNIEGKCFALFLGAELFNEMLDNYKFSLPRKRKRFISIEEKVLKIKNNVWRGYHNKKFKASKEEIEKLIYKFPKTQLASIYGVSAKTISNWCHKWGIKTPSRGDWAKMYSSGLNPKTKDDWVKIIELSK